MVKVQIVSGGSWNYLREKLRQWGEKSVLDDDAKSNNPLKIR